MRVLLIPLLAVLGVAAPLRAADPPKKPAAKSVAVPYRLTDSQHVMVRAKLNGKGPFNFILDTGAPAVFITTKVGEKVGAQKDKDGWAHFTRFEMEGGLVVDGVKGRVEDLFQLEGMNGMGLAGVELHGVIGYNVLARFKIQYDFTADKLLFKPLDFEPPPIHRIGGGGGGPASLQMLGQVMKLFGRFMGAGDALAAPKVRGCLGVELADADEGVLVKSVLADSPAAAAGLKPGDKIVTWKGHSVSSVSSLLRAANKILPGEKVVVSIERGGKSEEITVRLGKGL